MCMIRCSVTPPLPRASVVPAVPAGRRGRGFSLVELVLVIVIIGIIAAMAVPKLVRGAAGADEKAYTHNLTALRKAIDHYYAEHGKYPTAEPLSGNRTTIMLQLTRYTDAEGNYSETRSDVYKFGPYLREIPTLPLSPNRGRDRISTADGSSVAWIYDPTTGEIRGNTATAADGHGRLYSDY